MIGRGHDVTIKLADDFDITLKKYGEYQFKNIVLFAPHISGMSVFSFNSYDLIAHPRVQKLCCL